MYREDTSIWLRHHSIATSVIILFVAATPRVFLTWRSDPANVIRSYGDSVTYIRPAKSLIGQKAFLGKDGNPEITRTPGYPVFLASIMFFVGQDLRAVLVVQSLILSVEVVVLYWLAIRILPPLTAFVGGLLAAFSPWGAGLAGLPLTEGLYLMLLALIFLAMKLSSEADDPACLAIGGGCTGLLTAMAVLVRPIWPLVLLVEGALFFLYGPKRKGVGLLLTLSLIFSVIPLLMWKARNQQVSHFNGLSDIAGQTASQYLASRVKAHFTKEDRWELVKRAGDEESRWHMSIQEIDQERWRRASRVFKEHPLLTCYYFFLNSAEHMIHPSPDVLTPAGLNFFGDYWALAFLWGGLLILALIGWQSEAACEDGTTSGVWLSGLLIVCLLLTLSSGISFGGGSRFRMPLELIVPLLAAAGLVRIISKQKVRLH